jgi:1,2-diacylglycerol 3-alpha-glucosyltransferase
MIRRGYETFMRNGFDVLRNDPELDLYLFKGGGESHGSERRLHHLDRGGVAARILGTLVGRGPYVVEQTTFTASLIPHVVRARPDAIFFCDPAIGKALWAWRKIHGGGFRLLFHNGGPHPPPYPKFDFVQQVTPSARAAAIDAGEDPARQLLLPCALDFRGVRVASDHERAQLRQALGLPEATRVVLSVGALNRGHKRMDYLVREIAALPSPRPHLVMLGQEEDDTPAVRTIANMLLGESGYTMRSVEPRDVAEYYRAADVFVLASVKEGFGFAYAEAQAHGLPCISHDYPVGRYVLGDQGHYADLAQRGALTAALHEELSQEFSLERAMARHDYVIRRFGWQKLAPQYAAMFKECAEPRASASLAVA